MPKTAPFYDGAELLIAADCTAYAYANMHEEFMRGKITLIGCPKPDDVDYTEKLTEIIAGNDVKSMTIVRMEVQCSGELHRAAENALKNSGKFLSWRSSRYREMEGYWIKRKMGPISCPAVCCGAFCKLKTKNM